MTRCVVRRGRVAKSALRGCEHYSVLPFPRIPLHAQPVLGTPIFTGHKHDESLIAPPNRATDGTYGLALRVELGALAGGRIYQMSGRHMVRAVKGSLAGMANVCFLQWARRISASR